MAEKETKKMDRRDFLKISGMGAAGVVATGVAGKISAAQKAIAGTRRLGMVIDLRKCYGCHACQVACKAEFNVPLGGFKTWVKVYVEGTYPRVTKRFLPVLCNHCENQPCVRICPTKASHVEENGVVAIDENKCIGCGACITACPYNVRFFNKNSKKADKCDFCMHLVKKGIVPTCVNACPADARVFGDLNDPQSEISKLIASEPVQVLKPAVGTQPHVFYILAPGTKGLA